MRVGVPSMTRDTVGASPSRSTYRTEKRKAVRSSPDAGSTDGVVRTGARFTGGGGGDLRTSYVPMNGGELANPSNAVTRIVMFSSFVTANVVCVSVVPRASLIESVAE